MLLHSMFCHFSCVSSEMHSAGFTYLTLHSAKKLSFRLSTANRIDLNKLEKEVEYFCINDSRRVSLPNWNIFVLIARLLPSSILSRIKMSFCRLIVGRTEHLNFNHFGETHWLELKKWNSLEQTNLELLPKSLKLFPH